MSRRTTVRRNLGVCVILFLAILVIAGCARPAVQGPTAAPPANSESSSTTASAPYSQYDLVFAVAGDSRSGQAWMDPKGKTKPDYSKYINVASLTALRDDLMSGWEGSPGFFLAHLGDFGARGGTPIFDEFKDLMAPMWAKGMPTYVVKGNHEVRYYVPKEDTKQAETYANALKGQQEYQSSFATWTPPGAVSFNSSYSGLAYHFKTNGGATAIIVLDSYYVSTKDETYHKGYYSNPQLVWLRDTLAAYSKDTSVKHIFVMSHQPAFAAWDGDGSYYQKYNAKKAARSEWIMWALMDKYKVDAYFCGHSHFYHRWNIVGGKFAHQWESGWAPLGKDFDVIKEYAGSRSAWEVSIPQVLNGAAGAPLETGPIPKGTVPAQASALVANFSIVYVKGDTVTVEVYSYGDDTTTWKPKLIDKFQGRSEPWKKMDLVPEQPFPPS